MLDKIPMIETFLFEKYNRRVHIDEMKVYTDDIEIANIYCNSEDSVYLLSDKYKWATTGHSSFCEAVVAGYELAKYLLLNNDI